MCETGTGFSVPKAAVATFSKFSPWTQRPVPVSHPTAALSRYFAARSSLLVIAFASAIAATAVPDAEIHWS